MGAPIAQVQSTPEMQNPPQGKGAGSVAGPSALQNPSDKTNPYVINSPLIADSTMSDAFPPPGTQKTSVTEGNQSNLMQNMTQAGQPMQQAQQRQMGMPLGAVFNSSLGNNLMQTASPLEQPMGMPIPYDSTNTTTQQDMMGRNREASQTNLMQTMSQGKGNRSYSPTSGQPAMGQPNPYPNTVGMGDNSANTPSTGKGKGA